MERFLLFSKFSLKVSIFRNDREQFNNETIYQLIVTFPFALLHHE
jgi:hypothetical protein